MLAQAKRQGKGRTNDLELYCAELRDSHAKKEMLFGINKGYKGPLGGPYMSHMPWLHVC